MRALDTIIGTAIVFAIASTVSLAVEAPQLINYQGVLRDTSEAQVPQSGQFDMEFRFFDSDDCANLNGELLTDRHHSSGTGAVTANNGLFNVALGSGELLPAAATTLNDVFRGRSEVWLQVAVEGEILCPRTRVLASAYSIGSANVSAADRDVSNGVPDPTVLYVNGNGLGCAGVDCSDGNDGLTEDTAKRTIGGAIRALPDVLNSDVEVRIEPGIYEEGLFLGKRGRSGFYYVRLMNAGAGDVTLQGPSPVASGTGIWVTDDLTEIRGLTITNFRNGDGEGIGITALGGGLLEIVDSTISDNAEGLWVASGHEVIVRNSTFTFNDLALASETGLISLEGTATFDDNGLVGHTHSGGRISFEDAQTCTISSEPDAVVLEAGTFGMQIGWGICERNGSTCPTEPNVPGACCSTGSNAYAGCFPF